MLRVSRWKIILEKNTCLPKTYFKLNVTKFLLSVKKYRASILIAVIMQELFNFCHANIAEIWKTHVSLQ